MKFLMCSRFLPAISLVYAEVISATSCNAKGSEMDNEYRWLAVQLAGQLPQNREGAIKTLECLREIVDCYLFPQSGKSGRLTLVEPQIAGDRLKSL